MGRVGRARGLEPPNSGATSRCLNHLATPAVIGANVPINPTAKDLSPRTRSSWIPLALAIALGAGALVLTNPSPADLESFASERLVEEITDELCSSNGLPVMMRLAISNCPQLVRSQRQTLGRLVRDHAHRLNLGLFSLYQAQIGGQTLLDWQVPRFHATVLAIAGNFVLVESAQTPGRRAP